MKLNIPEKFLIYDNVSIEKKSDGEINVTFSNKLLREVKKIIQDRTPFIKFIEQYINAKYKHLALTYTVEWTILDDLIECIRSFSTEDHLYKLDGHDIYCSSWIIPIYGTDNEYMVYSGLSDYMRVIFGNSDSYADDGYYAIDPPGGPMLTVGTDLFVDGGKTHIGIIKRIYHSDTLGCFVINVDNSKNETIIFNDIKEAMRYVNMAKEDLIIRKNNIYSADNGNLIATIKLK